MSNGFEDAARVETVRIRGLDGQAAGGNFYDQVGGKETFRKIAVKFYEGVATDPDLGPATERLQLFLEQYWGGPSTYQELRGHPRLRLRHQPFRINPEAREHWLQHMKAAVESVKLSPLHEAEMWAYLDRAATAMLNSFDD
jgi:hemoglobin